MQPVRRRATGGNKSYFSNTTLLGQAEATVTLTQDDINKHTIEELYELAYGGDSDYFLSPVFNAQRKEEQEYITNMTRTLNVEESVHECPRCKYTKITVIQKQLRGGDEGMTTLLRCTKCGNEWRRD